VVLLTGDIAYSGRSEEYEQARLFLDDLRASLESLDRFEAVRIFMVPGNHDCDFGSHSDVRDLVIKGVLSGQKKLENGSDVVPQLLSCEAAFFRFQREVDPPSSKEPSWVGLVEKIVLSEKSINIACYNTALLSALRESQGNLLVPMDLVARCKTGDEERHDLMLTMFHHPYPWLTPENRRDFTKHVEENSDVVLTGHEHEDGASHVEQLTGESLNYIEGAAFQNPDGHVSSFSVIVCDLDNQTGSITTLEWDGSAYLPRSGATQFPFLRNRSARRGFENSSQYVEYLNDVGITFTHPRKADLKLDDIFVCPDLTSFSTKTVLRGREGVLIASETAITYILSQERLLILGAEQSGKTALAKQIYRKVTSDERLVPILLRGGDISSHREDSLGKLVRTAVSDQYGQMLTDRYAQLPPNKKLLIVEDWHKTRLNGSGQKLVIEYFSRIFEKVIVIASDIYRMEALAQRDGGPFFGFEFCEIREFGHVLHGRLIDKWYKLGQEYTADENHSRHEVDHLEQVIATLLGKNLVPYYPVVILTVLQAYEANKTANAPAGSYGYLNEFLITSSLAKAIPRATDLDTVYTFLGLLANFFLDHEQQIASQADLETLTDEYFSAYGIRVNASSLLGRLCDAKIIRQTTEGYRFFYRIHYYYFVARHLQDRLKDPAAHAVSVSRLKDMADRIHYDEYWHILMFVIYLTRDLDLIAHIVSNANSIYGGQKPCDFESDVEFINRLYKEPPKILIPADNYDENWEEKRKREDEADSIDPLGSSTVEAKLKYDEQLGDVIKLNISFKTLKLMGQILRNFPGSLKRDTKVELAKACYMLGLRTFNAMLKGIEQNFEGFRTYVAELIKAYRDFDTERELEQSTDQAIMWLTRACAFGTIKRVSYAVGLEILEETYKEVLQAEEDKKSLQLIDLSVRLDHFSGFPGQLTTGLARALRKNQFSFTVLRDLVANHIYLFELDYKTMQKFGQLLDIQTASPKYLTGPQKKLKRKG
jgi:hypothetical protein